MRKIIEKRTRIKKIPSDYEFLKRFITEIYPSGTCSFVADTYDLWAVLTDFLPRLKEDILARDGKVVIRPDSGDPVDIICGDRYFNSTLGNETHPATKGVIELLWDTFGGTVNSKGYKQLDPHVGAIYGDSINIERANEICRRLEEKGFASTNIVFGIGSFTYQYNTRDTFGMAMKATWVNVNGEGREIFKDPITDDGTKKSLKGLIKVKKGKDGLEAVDQVTYDEAIYDTEMELVFQNGKIIKEFSLQEIRNNVKK